MRKVLLIGNSDIGIYNFRLELVERLLKEGCEVWISTPYGKKIDELTNIGCHFIDTNIERHGMNPIKEHKLLSFYKKILNEIKPDIVFSYTVKPNVYGAMACKKLNIPFVVNITGLGKAVESGGLSQKIIVALYKTAFTKVQTIFFQNGENRQFFIDRKLFPEKHAMLPGSGVNLNRFPLTEYPSGEKIEFAFISRVMKEKGIEQYLDTAKAIKKKYPNTVFHVCGFCEDEYDGKLKEYQEQGIVEFHGLVHNVSEVYQKIHCLIHPTYYPEGMSNVLLEACATGRPIITTDRSGCREVVDNGVNGFVVKQKDSHDLTEKVEKFLNLSYDEKKAMGLAGRAKVEKEFDRQIVVEKYIKELNKVGK